jgi:hypothetical protein
MAFSGQVLDNPISGERFTFVQTAADTDGELPVVDLELSPGGRVPGAHVHAVQEERFEVTQGVLKVRKRGDHNRTSWRRGDRAIGEVHRPRNAGNATANVRVEVRPALRMEELFEEAPLAREGGQPQRHALSPRAGALHA